MDKKEFKKKANKSIDEIFDKVEKLNQKKDSLNSSLKKQYEKNIEALNKKKAELKKKYDAMQNTSDSNWEKAKKEFSESLSHYKAGFTELGKLFK